MIFYTRKFPVYSKIGAIVLSSGWSLEKQLRSDANILPEPIGRLPFLHQTVKMINRNNVKIISPVITNTNSWRTYCKTLTADCAASLPSERNSEVAFLSSPLNRGLLSNVDDQTGDNWSKQLNLEVASNFLFNVDKYLVKAFREDKDCDIEAIKSKADQYLKSNQFCGREQATHVLQSTFTSTGQFNCVLGGINFGKSKCVKVLAEQANTMHVAANEKKPLVIIIDMRAQGDKSVFSGLVDEISECGLKLPKVDCLLTARSSRSVADRIRLMHKILEELAKDYKVTIIIDEANLAYDRSDLSGEQIIQAQADLQLFTKLTKQDLKLIC